MPDNIKEKLFETYYYLVSQPDISRESDLFKGLEQLLTSKGDRTKISTALELIKKDTTTLDELRSKNLNAATHADITIKTALGYKPEYLSEDLKKPYALLEKVMEFPSTNWAAKDNLGKNESGEKSNLSKENELSQADYNKLLKEYIDRHMSSEDNFLDTNNPVKPIKYLETNDSLIIVSFQRSLITPSTQEANNIAKQTIDLAIAEARIRVDDTFKKNLTFANGDKAANQLALELKAEGIHAPYIPFYNHTTPASITLLVKDYDVEKMQQAMNAIRSNAGMEPRELAYNRKIVGLIRENKLENYTDIQDDVRAIISKLSEIGDQTSVASNGKMKDPDTKALIQKLQETAKKHGKNLDKDLSIEK